MEGPCLERRRRACGRGVERRPARREWIRNEDERTLLRDAGKRMGVLTNKPLRMTKSIIEGLGVGGHFFRLYGGDSFGEKKPHPMGVEALMREASVERGRTMMVGDSSVDVLTARNAGIASCGVTWGFQPETLADPAPDLLVDRMEQLADRLLQDCGE